MADMKLSAEERRGMETMMTSPASMDAPEYPWGLRITLEGPQLKKLGLDVSKLKPGGCLAIEGKVEIVSIRMEGDRQSIEAVICELEAEPVSEDKSTADLLYDGAGAGGD